MNKLVKGTDNVWSVQTATVTDVLNPTIPLADAQSNLLRIGAYMLIGVLLGK